MNTQTTQTPAITLSFNDAISTGTFRPLTLGNPGTPVAEGSTEVYPELREQILDHFSGLGLETAKLKKGEVVALCPKPLALMQIPLLQRVSGRLPTIAAVDGGSAVRGSIDLHVLRNEIVRAKSTEYKGVDDDGTTVYVVTAGRFPLTLAQKIDIQQRTGLQVDERYVQFHIENEEWEDVNAFISRRVAVLGGLRLPANAYGTGRVLYNMAGLGFLAHVDSVILDGIGERFPETIELSPKFDAVKAAQAKANGKRYTPDFVVSAIHNIYDLRTIGDQMLIEWRRDDAPVHVSRDLLRRLINGDATAIEEASQLLK